MRVFFFSTCLGSLAYADTCVNAIRLLQKEGCEVIFKKDQTCCAQPSYNSGYYEESRKVALHNIARANYCAFRLLCRYDERGLFSTF